MSKNKSIKNKNQKNTLLTIRISGKNKFFNFFSKKIFAPDVLSNIRAQKSARKFERSCHGSVILFAVGECSQPTPCVKSDWTRHIQLTPSVMDGNCKKFKRTRLFKC